MDRLPSRSATGVNVHFELAEARREIAVLKEQVKALREQADQRRSESNQYKFIGVTAVITWAIQHFMGGP